MRGSEFVDKWFGVIFNINLCVGYYEGNYFRCFGINDWMKFIEKRKCVFEFF